MKRRIEISSENIPEEKISRNKNIRFRQIESILNWDLQYKNIITI